MIQALKRMTLWGLTIVLIVLISMVLLLTTAPGLRMCLYFVNFWVPQLTIQNLSGNLFSLHAQEVQYRNESVLFRAKHLNYTLDPSHLRARILDLTSANAQDIEIQFLSPQADQKSVGLSIAELSGVGVVSFKNLLEWEARLLTKDVNSQTLLPGAHFNIGGQLQVKGQKNNEDWLISLSDLQYQGLLNRVNLSLNGQGQVDSAGWIQAQTLELKAGKSRLFFDGRVNLNKALPRVALNATIFSPDLSELLPSVKGKLNAKIAMQGVQDRPTVTFDVLLQQFKAQGTSLSKASLQGYVSDPTNLTGQLELQLHGASSDDIKLTNALLKIAGSEKNHEIRLTSSGSPLSVMSRLRGFYDRDNHLWTLAWPSANVTLAGQTWRLQAPTTLSLQTEKQILTLKPQCWGYQATSLCLSDASQVYLLGDKAFPLHVTLKHFNMRNLNRYVDVPLQLSGIVNGDVRVEVPQGFQGIPQAQFNLKSDTASLLYTLSESDTPLQFNELTVGGQIQKQFVEIFANAVTKDQATVALKAKVDDPMKARTFDSQVSIQAPSMKWLESFMPSGEKIKGQLSVDLSASGSLDKPQLFGSIQLNQFQVDSVTFPFEMQPSTLKMAFDGQRSDLKAKLVTQNGQMELKGQAQWSTINDVQAHLNLTTDHMRMMVPPTALLDVATDITCEASSERIKLGGLIRLPWARIKVKQIPEQAIKVSDDVVRLDQPRRLVQTSRLIPVQSNLFIEIGDDVKVDALGLKANLTGRLHVEQDHGRLGLNGQIQVPNGQYRAYGQSLEVRRGLVSFAGAVNNPQLDIEAIRSPEKTADNVVVGIRVTGSAKSPKLTVFSDPAMSEGEALSYLLSGEGLNANRENDAMIASALLGLGTTQSAQVLSAIGDAVGIEDLQLDTEGVGDTSQLIVSGYVLPGLKVKYGVGLFDSLSTLTLRYQIIPKLYLEVVSGIDQALDVLYQFEFD